MNGGVVCIIENVAQEMNSVHLRETYSEISAFV